MKRSRVVLVVLAILALVAPTASATGQPVLDCGRLVTTNFGDLGVLRSATEQTVGGRRYCAVVGEIAPQTGVRLMLPLVGWQGQYLQQGCSAYCGTSTVDALPLAGYGCAPALDGMLAMAKDDGGHSSASILDASFGQNPLLRKVFGRTSEHSTAQLAKAVLRAFYGRGPRYSYFDGCSTGGRQALVEAQNYPADFDGILAGAPVIDLAGLGLEQAWLVRSNTDAAGKQILPAEKLPALHAAVLAQCADAATGTVTEPRRCAFDPASLRCAPGIDTDACLTPAQVGTVRAFYGDVRTASGLALFNGGLPYGSELGWQSWAVLPRADTAAPGDTMAARLASGGFQNLFPSPSFTVADVPFTVAEYLREEGYAQRTYNATNPDLRPFRARGGKLILYHGLADEAVTPQSTVDYYARVERFAGGFAASQRFSRLYLVPGGYHCLFGPDINAPARVNFAEFLSPLLAWVEQGTAPGEIDAPDVPIDGNGGIITHQLFPVDALRPAPGSLNAG